MSGTINQDVVVVVVVVVVAMSGTINQDDPLVLKYSIRTSWACDSLPQSLTTTQLQPTTFLALPSLSILQRPAHSPSFLLSSTLMRLMLCSAHRASISFTYDCSSQLSARMHNNA